MLPYLIAFGVLLALLAIGGYFWLRTIEPEDDDKPMLAIVALLKEPQRVEPIYIVKAAEKAWGADLGSGMGGEHDQGEDGFVVGTEGLPTIVVSYRDRMIIVNNFDQPYFENPEEVAQQLPDLRLRDLVAGHTAWLSAGA